MTAYTRIAVVVAAGAFLFGCASTAEKKPAVSAAADKDPTCLTDTGSRVPRPSKCRGIGRSYSGTDIDRTGQTNAGDALALLDPAITVHR
jgi:hypothetical protein